jgi:hypothetical protein
MISSLQLEKEELKSDKIRASIAESKFQEILNDSELERLELGTNSFFFF